MDPALEKDRVCAKSASYIKLATLVREAVMADSLGNGTTFGTLADARDFILEQPEHSSWHQAAEQLINAAEEGGYIEAATKQIELALFFEGHFVLR